MNKQHPELREGEVFLTNCLTVGARESIGWSTARMGKVAYCEDGAIAEGAFPVFAQKSELEAAGVEVKKL